VSTAQDGFVWLEFPDHSGKQQFPAEAAPMWRARGWRDCDPPEAPNLLKDPFQPLLDDPQPERTPVPPLDAQAEPSTEPSTDTAAAEDDPDNRPVKRSHKSARPAEQPTSTKPAGQTDTSTEPAAGTGNDPQEG
jgi:hypothetical protein